MPIPSSMLDFAPSLAGVWQYVDDRYVTSTNPGMLANSFFGNVALGPSQKMGVVMTGWQYNGFSNTAQDVTPVNLGILAQQADGTLKLETSKYVDSAVTNGGGSVVVADFDSDGRSDVFLAAHNESPFISKASTVLLSNEAGTFTKVTLNDRVMAHDAELAMIGGKPAVVTASFSDDHPPIKDPVYVYDGHNNFAPAEIPNLKNTGYQSLAVADLNGDGRTEVVFGDLLFGPGYQFSPSNKMKIAIYDFSAQGLGSAPLNVISPYFETRPEYANVASAWGPANTHTFRVWTDDFNHDGRPDIVAASSLWNPANNTWPSMLQLLQNAGNLQFIDKSDTLNAGYDKNSSEADYDMQMVDLDGSGIKSYLSAAREYASSDRQANFLLVNDGTGTLHVALHEEFVSLGQQVLNYANSLFHDSRTLFVGANQPTPKFHGYVTSEGKLDYVAEVSTFKAVNGVNFGNTSVLINVPLELDLRTDFTTAITITDRNGSQLMRTFAGNDTIHQTNAAATAHIDGGLGIDTAVYTGAAASYTIGRSGAEFTVTGSGLRDTLANIERVKFSDASVALDLNGGAGMTAKILGALFGNQYVHDRGLVGIGLSLFDAGLNYEQVAGMAAGSGFFAQLAGSHSNRDFVNLVYKNVVGVAPSESALASFVALLDSHAFTQASLAVAAADNPLNLANIDLVGLQQTGLAYA